MRKFALTLAAMALSAGALIGKADAMPLGATGPLAGAADGLTVVEKSQYSYGGRRYCWYPDGWRGPGYYWCGYHLRRGLGWGGPVGWRGWGGGPGPRAVIVGPRRGGPVMVAPRRGGPVMVVPRGGGGGPKGFRRH